MNNIEVGSPEFIEIFVKNYPLIDVRAPVEFQQGSLPGAVNIPILNDDERTLIGTVYKKEGKEAALLRGYELISGIVKKERMDHWIQFVENNPMATFYCFRGGKRSQITQQWLRDAGLYRPLLQGGFKQARIFFIETIANFSSKTEMLSLTGPTGSGKTSLISALKSKYPVVDLEALAHHRGSAFGSYPISQPSQIDFENRLAVALIKLDLQNNYSERPIIEDESRMIGQRQIPGLLFDSLRRAPVIWLDTPIETRIQNIFQEYVINTPIGDAFKKIATNSLSTTSQTEALLIFAKYRKSLQSIQRKLGGVRTQEVMKDIVNAENAFVQNNDLGPNRVWIEKLLTYYYDPLYMNSLKRRQPKIYFKGTAHEVLDFLKSDGRVRAYKI